MTDYSPLIWTIAATSWFALFLMLFEDSAPVRALNACWDFIVGACRAILSTLTRKA